MGLPAGEVDVTITGIYPFKGTASGEFGKVVDVKQRGSQQRESMAAMFSNHSNLLTISASDAPDLSNVTDMSDMFNGASNFNGNINGWDVSNIETMARMFANAQQFDQPLSGWNVGMVDDMSGMFNGAVAFDQDISGWNVSEVDDMASMFGYTGEFNQDISGWNVSEVDTLSNMFQFAGSFNQNLGAWNITDNTNLSHTFSHAPISVENYDAFLIAQASKATPTTGINLGANGLQYCEGEAAREQLISTYGWGIADSGKEAGCTPTTGGTTTGSSSAGGSSTGGGGTGGGGKPSSIPSIPTPEHNAPDTSEAPEEPESPDMPDELPEPKTPTQQCEPEYVVTVAGEILDDDTVNGEFTQSLLFANIFELTQYESVDTFRKYDTTRRDEAAKLLANFSINALCRSVTGTIVKRYSDEADIDTTLFDHVQNAYELGIMKGSDTGNVFRPTEAITKEQVVAMIIRILTGTYLDESGAYWYENYMEEAKNRGIIDEYTLGEESPILRHELIALLWRTYSVGQ